MAATGATGSTGGTPGPIVKLHKLPPRKLHDAAVPNEMAATAGFLFSLQLFRQRITLVVDEARRTVMHARLEKSIARVT